MNRMLAVILAGGRGKRMDLLCHLRPKPSLPFAGIFRVVDFSLSNCIHSLIDDITVLTDYQRARMSRYLTQWSRANLPQKDLNILEPRQGSYKGTADAVYQNLDYLKQHSADRVMVLAGDHVYKMDYRKVLAFHQYMKSDVTVGVIPVPIEQAHRFGIVMTDGSGRITDFVEKPAKPAGNLVSMGIYLFNKDVLIDYLKEDAGRQNSVHDFGYSIIPEMVKRQKVFACKFDDYWQDIGTIDAYYTTNMELTRQNPSYSMNSNWPIFTIDYNMPPPVRPQRGTIKNSLVSPGCVVDGYVENSILSPGVHVDEKAEVRNSVVMADTTIGYHSVVDRCVLDEGVKVGDFCYIGFGVAPGKNAVTVLGERVTVPSHTAVGRGCKVHPHVGPSELTGGLVPADAVVNKKPSAPLPEERRILAGIGVNERRR